MSGDMGQSSLWTQSSNLPFDTACRYCSASFLVKIPYIKLVLAKVLLYPCMPVSNLLLLTSSTFL